MAEQKEKEVKEQPKEGKPKKEKEHEKPKQQVDRFNVTAKDMKEGIKGIVRILGSDVGGNKKVEDALRQVKGVSHNMAHTLRVLAGYDDKKKIGLLPKEELTMLEDMIKNPLKHGVPVWMVNRRKDIVTGDDKHISSTDLDMSLNMDIKRLVEIRTRRGLRLSWGLPVRGQRTRAGYTHPPRRIKRRGNVIGVSKKKMMPAATGEAPAKDKGSEKK